MTPNQLDLLNKIHALTPLQRQETPFPQEWLIDEREMIQLLDAGVVGMDGFKYQFVEYAKECFRRCQKS